MQLNELIHFFEKEYPLQLQEDYDNCGLQIGDTSLSIRGILVSLDCSEAVVTEAIEHNCNLIICHHPLLFYGLKQIGASSYVERVVRMCIKNDIAVYAIHTNLDNHPEGVNAEIGRRIGLINTKILAPKTNALYKLIVYTPKDSLKALDAAIFKAGGGGIGNYTECHFRQEGIGTFTPGVLANPTSGTIGVRSQESELKVEYIVDSQHLPHVLKAMNESHPYEEVAHDIILLKNQDTRYGAGLIGELETPCEEMAFLAQLKKIFNSKGIRHTKLITKPIKKVALCGGSGSFLTKDAIRSGADCYITADIKYHEFFDADERILLIDIGHYESEQYTSTLLIEKIKENFTNFAVRLSEINTNPINYL